MSHKGEFSMLPELVTPLCYPETQLFHWVLCVPQDMPGVWNNPSNRAVLRQAGSRCWWEHSPKHGIAPGLQCSQAVQSGATEEGAEDKATCNTGRRSGDIADGNTGSRSSQKGSQQTLLNTDNTVQARMGSVLNQAGCLSPLRLARVAEICYCPQGPARLEHRHNRSQHPLKCVSQDLIIKQHANPCHTHQVSTPVPLCASTLLLWSILLQQQKIARTEGYAQFLAVIDF